MRRIVVLILAVLLAGVVGYAALAALRDSEAYGAERVGVSAAVPGHVCGVCRGLDRNVRRWCPAVRRALVLWHGRFNLRLRVTDRRTALVYMWRESRGIPTALNRSSGAAGLYQWLPFWWQPKGYPIFDPRWNIGMMAQYHAGHEARGMDPWAPWR